MSDLLIRDINQETMNALAARAARYGRSPQAEARAIIESALRADSRDWVTLLRNAADTTGGIEIGTPKRHFPRTLDFGD